MPTISAKLIRKPRKTRRCEMCSKYIEGFQVRMYGSAHEHDKPYAIYSCVNCVQGMNDKKATAALVEAQGPVRAY